MTVPEQTGRETLKQWISRVYMRSSMIQLVLLNALFLLLLFALLYLLEVNHSTQARKEQQQDLIQALQSRTDWVSARLSSVESSLQLLQQQAQRLVQRPGEGDRQTPLALTEQNVLMKPVDDGGVAVYYSTLARDLSVRERNARQWLPLSPVMADLQQANALVKQIYLNTPDQLNLLYPYQDVARQFAPDLDLTSFSFYYLADKEHNPRRQSVWTDAYLDPAGLGWIISHIAPVYRGEGLEAVVGVDLTVDSLINNLFSLPRSWSGYSVLIGKDGNILALPPEGEDDFNLQELTDTQYSFRQITTNEFKPELYNLYKRPELSQLARMVSNQQAGLARIELSQPSVVAWNTVPLTGWKLMAVTPEASLYAEVVSFSDYLLQMALLSLLVVMGVTGLHLGLQRSRGHKLCHQLHKPLEHICSQLDNALDQERAPVMPALESRVREVDWLTRQIARLAEEHQQLQQTVRQQQSGCSKKNEYFRTLLNSLPVPVFDTDGEYRLQGCNRAFESFFGKTEAELRQHLLTELLPVSLPTEGVLSKEIMLSNARGQNRYVYVMICALPDAQRSRSDVRAVLGMMVDLSDQHQVREQMRADRDRAVEASQLREEYLQAMRQELKEPLIKLSSLTEKLCDQPEEYPRLSLQLKEKTDALLFLTRDNWLYQDEDRITPAEPAPVLPDPETAGDEPARTSRPQVLVVDDGPVNTMLAKSVLERAGYGVDIAYSGQEALTRLTEKNYQVVLMDIFMPEMDGIETTCRWREREKAMQRTPAAIIALTANVIESERKRFFDAGMNEYLAKPYQPTELRARVDYWRRLQEEGQVSA